MPNLKPSRTLMQLLYENAIYFSLQEWVDEDDNFKEEDMRKAKRVLQEKYSYSE